MATRKRADERPRRSIRKTPRSQEPAASDQLPLTLDDLLERDNTPASEPIPPDIAQRISTRTFFVSSPKQRVRREQVEIEHRRDVAALQGRLPPQAVLGLLGQTMERLPLPTSEKRAARPAPLLEAFRPRWTDHVYHPKRTIAPPWEQGPVVRPGYIGEVHFGVYPPEDRVIYYPRGYPWQCVGKVYAWTNPSGSPAWSGSGVLVGPRMVLTAGHVVPWDSNPWMMQFVPAYYDGASILGDGGASYVSDVHGWDVSFRSRAPDAYDMAILRLFDPLGSWFGFFGSKPYPSGNLRYWNINGYPGAISSGQRPSYQPGIEVLATEARDNALEIKHHGDSTSGNSGSPFWATWPDGFPYAIGTVSGGEANASGDYNIVAGGNALSDLINWGRANWP